MRLTIDGRNVEAAEGMSILQAAKTVGIEIPTLCYLEGISDIGSCRLCVVEVEGMNELATACNTKAKEGMVVQTASERVIEARKTVLKLLQRLISYVNRCLIIALISLKMAMEYIDFLFLLVEEKLSQVCVTH